jgi:uncharacterized membrane protein YhaH (DUF805 family)
MKRNLFWMVWGIVTLVSVTILGTKNLAAEASVAPSVIKKPVFVNGEQYKVLKSLINKKNR